MVNDPQVYRDGASWSKRAAELIGQAQESVVAVVFLGSWSPQTEPIYQALITKAREGLPVYVVIDASSSFEYTASSLKMKSLHLLREHGVHLLEYNPLTVERIFMLPRLLLREHRKYLVVDGVTVALGGMNFNYASLQESSHPEGQRDSMYVFQSPQLATLLLEGFVDFWNDNSWDPLAPDTFNRTVSQQSFPEGTMRAWVADQLAGGDKISRMFTAMFDAATEQVLLLPMMPFLSNEMKASVRKAVDRGVVVRMLLPYDMRDANREPVQYAALDLLDLGIELYRERQPVEGMQIPLLHEKLMIVDKAYAIIGSANFNLRSMHLANELSLVVEGEEFTTRLRAHFEMLMRDAQLITRAEALSWRNLETIPTYLYLYFGG
jgi:cardiolipin synthase